MEESAPKRRRTSPRTRVAVDDTTGQTGQTAQTPTGRPSVMTEPTTTDATPTADSAHKRPSFASPTKASLSRHNPQILTRRSQSRSASRPEEESRQASRLGTGGSDGSLSDMLQAQAQLVAESHDDSHGQAPESAVTGVSEADSHYLRPRPSSSRKLGGGLASAPRRSPAKPDPRPLPPPGPEADEDLLNPVLSSRPRRLPKSGLLVVEPVSEPQLPPTPTELGIEDPVVTKPPSGIHSSSSPSKRARKAKRSRGKGSPLKQPPLRPPGLERPGGNAGSAEQDDTGIASDSAPAPSRHPGTHPARKIPPPDPHGEKKKTRDLLRNEIAQLETDLELAITETERLRQMRNKRYSGVRPALPLSRDELLRLVKTHLLPPEVDPRPHRLQQWLDTMMDSTLFLPFSNTLPAFPTAADAPEALPGLKSHHPVAMKAEEELPFLQVFTPLAFSSQIVVLPKDGPNGPLLQRHYITARSASQGQFVAKVEMTVNAKHLDITDLTVPKLHPSSISELAPFIDRVLHRPRTSAMTRNVSIITWAMGEWYRIALQRAHVWSLFGKEFGPGAAFREVVMRMRSKSRKRKMQPGTLTEEAGEESEGVEKGGGLDGDGPQKEDLTANLGRNAFEIPISGRSGDDEDEESTLRIQWKIEFDWTGEGRSDVSALVGAPGKCEYLIWSALTVAVANISNRARRPWRHCQDPEYL
jgi:hypothetical protein